MRKLLRIGEMARLLDISTSKIRYYEKEGLVKPLMIDENGYRLYDFQQLDDLEFILLMKDIHIPLGEIKAIMRAGDGYDYQKIIAGSIEKIDREIKDLEEKKRRLSFQHDDFMLYENTNIEVVDMPERVLHVEDWVESNDMTIKELYDFITGNGIPYMDYKVDFYSVMVDEKRRFDGFHSWGEFTRFENFDLYKIEAGSFVSMRVQMDFGDRSFDVVERLIEEAGKRDLKLTGERLIIDELSSVAYSRKKRHVTVQMRIEE